MQTLTEGTVTLYHGTSEQSATRLLQDGWNPLGTKTDHAILGGQCGQSHLLYLTTTPDNALWYAQQKMDGQVLQVVVPVAHLIVDPEDGIGDTVEEELQSDFGLPGNVALTTPLDASAFTLYKESQ